MKRARESDYDYDYDCDDVDDGDGDGDDDADSDSEMKGVEDRLSDLPDCILTHIMTFLTTKDVVCTAILSRRWKDLWKHVPSLVLCTSDFKFRRMTRFNESVSKFLLLRDGSVPLLNVDVSHFARMPSDIQTSVSEYAVMHKVEQLRLRAERFPHLSPCVFTSQILTSLHLSSSGYDLLPKTLNMGALTSLHIKKFAFCVADNESLDPFSSCVKLKNLVIEHCSIKHSKTFCISNATLLSARTNLSFLKEVTIDFGACVDFVDCPRDETERIVCLQPAFIIIDWLQVFANIRSLTICSGTLKVLSLTPELLNTGSPGLDNLQLLIVKLKKHSALIHKRHRATYFRKKADFKTTLVYAGVVDYLIQNSPFAEVNLIKRADISLMANNTTEPNVKRARESDTDYDYDCDDVGDGDGDDDADSESEMEVGEDRLSDLPDCILIHIMTFLTTKDVVCTSILSRRWKDLWKHVPSLVLCTSDFKFRRMTRFNEAVSKFLLLRDGSVPLLNVDVSHFARMPPDIQTSVSEYAVMHKVEQLRLRAERFPHLSPCVFTTQTLTSLHLSSSGYDLLPKTLNMGALTSLHIKKDETERIVCLQSAFIIIEWLQVFANIRSLTICSGTLKVLSLTPELLNTGSPGLDNLQLLIVKLKKRSALLHKRHRATYFRKNADFKTTLVHAGVVDYLIRNSPFTEVNLIKRYY
ncbi:hypothetical protein PIB30_020226 [Stylosanthes scabra]|uniref:F-box domain-containing protein n=1 Tax=Stylosanthes scabra TaxID=79078 RepID=A0ABU6S7Y4_9FABA|nr:hypothetical protein [Stylosanthes scabra]